MMGGVLIYGFAAAVLGGLTSPLGAVVGGSWSASSRTSPAPYIPGVGNELKTADRPCADHHCPGLQTCRSLRRAIIKRV